MLHRVQKLKDLGGESCFLWGPRQTGKSTLLKNLFPHSPYYDLLLSNEFKRLSHNPALIREELLLKPPQNTPVIIDEIQNIPALLDEVQWLIVNKNLSFILCGSSARKLKRTGVNLLGGRAFRYELFPLVFPEIGDFDLIRALNHGLLPRHYLGQNHQKMLEAYVGTYLKEEIAAEALVRNLPAFARFLEVAAFSNGEFPVYSNIASDCGVNGKTVKEYFQILEDTLLGRFCPSFRKKPKRRVIESAKFYYFDVGLANYLLKRGKIDFGGEAFGKAFEHTIFMELTAYAHYSGKNFPVSYWRTTSGMEVDFILGEHQVAIEVKGTPQVQGKHQKGLKAFNEEYAVKKNIIVSLDSRPRQNGNILVLPWKEFLNQLWSGEVI